MITAVLLCALAGLESWPGDLPGNGNLLNFERMGAGAPAGWKVEQRDANWEADVTEGPLGPGAARIRMGAQGRIELMSPARALRTGQPHVLTFWVRSESAGARISVKLRDNNRDSVAGLDKTETADATWRQVIMACTPADSVKGHYYLSIAIEGSDASVWIDGLWFGERPGDLGPGWQPDYRVASLVLTPEVDWGVVTGNAPLRIHARAVGALPEHCRIWLHATPVDGTMAWLRDRAISSDKLWEDTFAIEGDAANLYGMLRVEGVIVSSTAQALSPIVETLLTRVPEPVPGPCPDSPFGIHVQLREPDIAAMARFGYKWCRIHDASGITKWGLIETAPGTWEWHDDQVDMARRHGLSIVGMLDSAPPWHTGTNETGYFSIYHAPKDLDLWRNYVRQVVGHYAGRIDEWEVWNEPWDMKRFFQGGTPKRYAELLKTAYQEAKAVNPACMIIGVDTYPPFWDAAVLASGAYGYYDLLSWHRYDSNLQGRPNDGPARVAQRLHAAQAWYGTPKPTIATEGGIDVTIFQGSFFSFADPAIVGDWSEGADRYARLFLSTIAAGHRRFITYSVHNPPRHGLPTHMMSEPGPLARPLHATLAALASFVEGAHYRERLVPAPDISAHVFDRPSPRPFADGPSVVVALIADGAAPEPLPRPLPPGIRCYDRWGNPSNPPVQATRAIAYLVADTATSPALLDALRNTNSETGPQSIRELLQVTARSLAGGDPPLWRSFSAQGSLLLAPGTKAGGDPPLWHFNAQGSLRLGPGTNGPVAATRATLRTGERKVDLPTHSAPLEVTGLCDDAAGLFRIGSAEFETDGKLAYSAFFTATQDGPGDSWRYLTLTLIPADAAGSPDDRKAIEAIAERWAAGVRKGTSADLHGLFHDGAKCVAASTLNGEYFVFDDPEYLITMLNTAIIFGKAPISTMKVQETAIASDTAVLAGRWDIASLPLGIAAYKFTASFHRTTEGWRLVTFCMGV